MQGVPRMPQPQVGLAAKEPAVVVAVEGVGAVHKHENGYEREHEDGYEWKTVMVQNAYAWEHA